MSRLKNLLISKLPHDLARGAKLFKNLYVKNFGNYCSEIIKIICKARFCGYIDIAVDSLDSIEHHYYACLSPICIQAPAGPLVPVQLLPSYEMSVNFIRSCEVFLSCKQKYSFLADLVFQVLISKYKFFKYKNQLLSYEKVAIDWMLDGIACLRGIHELVMRYA